MKIHSVALNSIFVVIASFLAAGPLAHADGAMLTLHATAANAGLPIPPAGLNFVINVNPASANPDQIQGILIKSPPLTAPNGDAYPLIRINAGFAVVPPPFANLLRIKGTNVSPAAGGPVDMTYAAAHGTRVTQHYLLKKDPSGWITTNEQGQRVDTADVTLDMDPTTNTLFISSWR